MPRIEPTPWNIFYHSLHCIFTESMNLPRVDVALYLKRPMWSIPGGCKNGNAFAKEMGKDKRRSHPLSESSPSSADMSCPSTWGPLCNRIAACLPLYAARPAQRTSGGCHGRAAPGRRRLLLWLRQGGPPPSTRRLCKTDSFCRRTRRSVRQALLPCCHLLYSDRVPDPA